MIMELKLKMFKEFMVNCYSSCLKCRNNKIQPLKWAWTCQIVWIGLPHYNGARHQKGEFPFQSVSRWSTCSGREHWAMWASDSALKVVTWRPSRLRCFLEFLHKDKMRTPSWKVSPFQRWNQSFGRWLLPWHSKLAIILFFPSTRLQQWTSTPLTEAVDKHSLFNHLVSLF